MALSNPWLDYFGAAATKNSSLGSGSTWVRSTRTDEIDDAIAAPARTTNPRYLSTVYLPAPDLTHSNSTYQGPHFGSGRKFANLTGVVSDLEAAEAGCPRSSNAYPYKDSHNSNLRGKMRRSTHSRIKGIFNTYVPGNNPKFALVIELGNEINSVAMSGAIINLEQCQLVKAKASNCNTVNTTVSGTAPYLSPTLSGIAETSKPPRNDTAVIPTYAEYYFAPMVEQIKSTATELGKTAKICLANIGNLDSVGPRNFLNSLLGYRIHSSNNTTNPYTDPTYSTANSGLGKKVGELCDLVAGHYLFSKATFERDPASNPTCQPKYVQNGWYSAAEAAYDCIAPYSNIGGIIWTEEIGTSSAYGGDSGRDTVRCVFRFLKFCSDKGYGAANNRLFFYGWNDVSSGKKEWDDQTPPVLQTISSMGTAGTGGDVMSILEAHWGDNIVASVGATPVGGLASYPSIEAHGFVYSGKFAWAIFNADFSSSATSAASQATWEGYLSATQAPGTEMKLKGFTPTTLTNIAVYAFYPGQGYTFDQLLPDGDVANPDDYEKQHCTAPAKLQLTAGTLGALAANEYAAVLDTANQQIKLSVNCSVARKNPVFLITAN